MYRSPQAECYIISGTGLDRGHMNSIRFHTEQEQEAYFISKAVKHFEGLSQIRFFGGEMRLELNPNRAYAYDYLMFRNIPTGNEVESRWIYAFIDSAEYVNDATVHIRYTIDWIQTYFVLVSKNTPAGYCIRQHDTDDRFYTNTQPEPISTGMQYLQKAVPGWSNIGVEPLVDNDGNFVNWAPVIVIPKPDVAGNQLIDGVPNKVSYIWGFNWTWFNDIIDEMNEDAKNSIIDIFMYPVYLLNNTSQKQKRYVQRIPLPGKQFNPWKEQYDWTPKNNKLYTYPYCFMTVKGANQASVDYYAEFFSGNTLEAEFHIYGSMSNMPQFLCVPIHYNGVVNLDEDHLDENFQAGVIIRGTPKVPWITDQYKVYLAQNESQIAIQNTNLQWQQEKINASYALNMANTGIDVLKNLDIQRATNNIVGATMQRVDANMQLSAQQAILQDAKNMSNIVSNYGANNIYYACGEYGFRALYTFCSEEYARIADNYFTVFGYAMNKIRRPNFFNRKVFSYFKYAGFAISQNIRMPDAARSQWMEVMKNGITFWNPDAKIGNYNVDNGVTV